MKKLIGIFILSFFIFLNPASSNEKLINSLKKGGKLIFIRHAYAPGNGDPKNFNLNDCTSQRNLNLEGINQSKKIGLFFNINKIQLDKVLSSEWCRCKDTAKYAFNNYETFNALNSFYDVRFVKNKNKQIRDLKKYINNWDGKKNLVLVTHFVVISETLNMGASSGEIIITDKNFSVIGSIKTK
jgi:phosphohistidine phosphatase SixA|tara:strand:- start:169 stop:720 length:552 start_codon:yes stop_codon:yes gene_type:complete